MSLTRPLDEAGAATPPADVTPRHRLGRAPMRAAVRAEGVPIAPPDDDEVWSYVRRGGEWFMPISALSKIALGAALVFLALRGDWLMLLLPFAVMVVVGGVIGLVWSTQVAPFDRSVHEERRRRRLDFDASVDVFILTCGEDPDVVENTIMHATRLRHRAPLRVYVLDDAASDDLRARAERWGATYMSRPDRGWMKKSGNLKHGYDRTDGAFILVLDADFAVRPDFLSHTVPYFDDASLGILQTPQYFRVSADNWVERGAAAQQEQFYRLGMRARDRHQGAICVGTNAVYRREALDARGGMALLEHSEDIFTGMKVIDAGYRVAYLPLPLAAGSTPDTVRSLASQQYRWARGNFALAGTPLFKRMRLTFMQRLGIWDGWIFYVTSAFSPVVALFVPIVALAEAPEAITLAPAAMVLPALITEFVLQPRWLFLSDGRASRRVGLISQVSHLYALRDHLTDRDQEWIPTGGDRASTKQSTDRIPDLIAAAGAWGFAAIITLLGARILTGWSLADLAPVGVLAAIALPAALGVAKPAIDVRPVDDQGALDGGGATRDGRDGFLDLVRATSIVRVMFWHALGYWWISWTFAAMPAVFYVSGAVLAVSMQRSSATAVVRARLRRLLPPYAAFVGLALAAVIAAEPSVLTDQRRELLSWVVPYRSPAPLAWEEGWLSTPLWFLRALVFVLLATPAVLWVARRVSSWIMWPLWAATLIALDVLISHQTTEEGAAIIRGIGDVVCFGGFFALGAVAHARRYRWSRRVRIAALAVLVAVTGAVALIAPPPDDVVNNSYVMFGLVGLVWLVALFTVEDHLRHIATIPAVARFVGWMTSGAMSIYLWHTFALCIAYWLIGGPSSPGELAVLIAVFAMVMAVVVPAVRPLETLGGGRPAAVRPGRIMAVGAVALVLVGQPTLFPVLNEIDGPPVPSGRPAAGGRAEAVPPTPVADGPAPSGDDAEAWLVGHEVAGAAVVEIGAEADAAPGTVRLGDEEALDPAEPFEVLSVTKTMVAAIALQLVDEGALTLDGALPEVDGVPSDLTDALTLRRVLAHATGLPDYREVAGYRDDMALTPAEAVTLAAQNSEYGIASSSYAATNYLLAGLVIEEVTGQPLSEIMAERLFEPLGLDDTRLVNNTREGFVGQGSGGVVSTLTDLAVWYDALMRGDVLSDASHDELLYGGMAYSRSAGLGSWRRCPCVPPTADTPEPFLYAFHDGGDVRVVYVPSRDVVMAMRFSRPLYDERRVADGLDDFVFAVIDLRGDVEAGGSAGDER